VTTYEEWRVTGTFREEGSFEVVYTPPEDGDAETRALECAAWARTQDLTDGPHLHKRTVTVTDWTEVDT
jgi:hypothetical protein